MLNVDMTNDGENGATADATVATVAAADDAAAATTVEDAGGDQLQLFLKVRKTDARQHGGADRRVT